MIIGAHSIIRSTNPEADCAFLRDVLKLTHVDEGGYLIFGLPPAEVSPRWSSTVCTATPSRTRAGACSPS
jgi:hypothetical protein